MNLPDEITVQTNDVNGAPYLGYEGGEGVVYVPKNAVSDMYDALDELLLALGDIRGFDYDDYLSPEVTYVRAALSKVRGET